MPINLSPDRQNDFKKFQDGRQKTIQRAYNFFVTIENSDIIKGGIFGKFAGSIREKINFPAFRKIPTIESYHVQRVTVPQHTFKKEVMMYGPAPRTFPVYSSEGLFVRIEFEEDANGTIQNFIHWCQERVMDQDGLYRSPGLSKIDRITVDIMDASGDVVMIYRFFDCYLQDAIPITYDYSANNSILHTITFGVDFFEIEFNKEDRKGFFGFLGKARDFGINLTT